MPPIGNKRTSDATNQGSRSGRVGHETQSPMQGVRRVGQGIQGRPVRPMPGDRQEVSASVQASQLIAIDTETTGLDHFHGARPYFVTTCNVKGQQEFWQWDVDPLTREVAWNQEDVWDLAKITRDAASIVGHNVKFDVHALVIGGQGLWDWPWAKVNDTIIAGHLLSSNTPHNLTDMAMQWLGLDIEPLEKRLEKVVQTCRRAVQQARLRVKRSGEDTETTALSHWAIAEEGRPDMPSVKGKSWKQDAWLPRAMVKAGVLPETIKEEEALRVLADYANADSAATLRLWLVLEQEMRRRGLWEIYLERMKLVPIFWEMEDNVVTCNKTEWQRLRERYLEKSSVAADRCVTIAEKYKYELDMPKSGNNGSLVRFCFDVLKLPVVGRTDTGNPSLDKDAMAEYLVTLPQGSKQLEFIENLSACRTSGTMITYLDGYERFWLPIDGSEEWYGLHPNINTTGTKATRQSSSNPNSQNVKKGEGPRACFGPAPGREWYALDGENLELRIPAFKSGERSLIELFEKPNDPPFYGSQHLLNFSIIFADLWKIAVEEAGTEGAAAYVKEHFKEEYKCCKNGDFAIQYGAVLKSNGWGTADKAFGRKFSHQKLVGSFEKLGALNRKQIDFANRHGYVETVPDKTVTPRHGYPLICAVTERGKVLETVPLSYHVQGTAGWWMMKAMIRCKAKLDQWKAESGFNGRMVLQVHDELVFDFPKRGDPIKESKKPGKFRTSNLWRIRVLQQLMEQGGDDIGVPTPVAVEYHEKNWAEGKKV